MNEEELDDLIESLNVMKLKKIGKYSSRYKKKENPQCDRCQSDHQPGRCPANSMECYTCGGKNYFSKSAMCKGRQVKRVATEDTDTKSYSKSRMDVTDPVRKIVTTS